MTDWTKTSGRTGKMMIRDRGRTVEFWFKAGYSSDWMNGMRFSWTAHGDTYSKSINYPQGAHWYHVASVTVTYSQTVTFRLLSHTTITGIGGPTTFSHAIKRATVPSAPTRPTIRNISTTSLDVSFSPNSDGGASIVAYQITYSTSSSGGTTTISSDRSTHISGLTPGATYYFWARARNSVGWSHWSGYTSAKTIAGARIKVGSAWKLAIPYVRVGGTWKMAEPWVRSSGVWKRTI